MAYADQQGMSTGRLTSIVLVILLHVFLGYAFVTGLAYEAVKKAAEKLNVVDIQEEKPPEEEPPPPPPDDVLPPPPPVFAQETKAPTENKSTQSTDKTDKKPITEEFIPCNGAMIKKGSVCAPSDVFRTCPPPSNKVINVTKGETCPPPPPETQNCPDGSVIAKAATCPVKKAVPKRPNPIPRGNVGSWVTSDDYPSRDLQQEHQGSVSVRLTVGPTGRVSDCSVTSSSGFPGLDSATCSKIKSRAKFDPALDGDGNPTSGSYSKSVRWVVPKE
jgi:periplasmic protein TonB